MPFAPRIAFVDVETTGTSPGHDRITEIAIVSVECGPEGWQASEWHSLVNPGQPIPPEIRFLTGITDEMVAQAPSFADLAPEILSRLQSAVFVAHLARFDYGFVRAGLERAGHAFSARTLCTVRLSRLMDPDRAPHSKTAAPKTTAPRSSPATPWRTSSGTAPWAMPAPSGNSFRR